ncbi:acetoacetate decarboxylase [Mesorhizobium sp. M0778]|uniref:acetoacetate decarboxylase n=1 Tax=Mesorhizobium sp. M0778 TaxID=2956999 RepID=UPI003336F60B
MEIADVVKRAYAMPLTKPVLPARALPFLRPRIRHHHHRTTREALEAVVPAPLEIDEPLVKYEFIRMPDSTGFGDYTETGQVIPVRFQGQHGTYVHSMFLDDDAPIAGGRELWGFPKKLASPKIVHEGEVVVGTLHYGSVLCATGTMGYKHRPADHGQILASLAAPNFLIKIIPHVDGTPRICELVRYHLTDVTLKEAWTAPAALDLRPHVMADVARLPVLEIVSAVHFIADLTLGLGEVVYDYLAGRERSVSPNLEAFSRA